MNPTHYFTYTNGELESLKSKDKRLKSAIEIIGDIRREIDSDMFSSVIHHIIAQQISSKALNSIWKRFIAMCDKNAPKITSNTTTKNMDTTKSTHKRTLDSKNSTLNAESVLNLGADTIRSCGISTRKVEYILDFAHKVQTREFDIESVRKMNDEKAIEELVKLRGIGVWTAEMILLFCLQRKDILSYDDLAIQRAIKMLYNLKGKGKQDKIPKDVFAKYRAKFSPHCSLASLYLWEIASEKFEI